MQTLLGLLAKPALEQRSSAPFWDDPHISLGMLKAHLDPDTDASSYRLATIEGAVDWLSALLPPGSRLLDLGCGPGLYTARLAQRGYQVTGMDYSRRSIAYAQDHDPRSRYLCQNYLTLEAESAFDAITLISCDYGALIQAERRALLPRVYRALKPGGRFILDVFTPAAAAKKRERATWSAHPDGGYWSARPHICLQTTHLYCQRAVSVDQYVVLTSDGVTDYLLWDTVFSPESLTGELTAWGFTAQGVYGDVRGSAYTVQSDTLCMVARKPR